MNKSKNLIRNTGILAIGSFSSKILTFLLVPVYTAVLSENDYGSYDLILSTINLLIPVLTLNISDAALRFPMDEKADVGTIAKSGLFFVSVSAMTVLAVSHIPSAPWEYLPGSNYIPYLYLVMSLYQFLIMLARGMERMRQIAIAGIVSTVAIFFLTIWLLLYVHAGLDGYFLANIVGLALPCLYLLVSLRVAWCGKSAIDIGLVKKMIKYSIPLAMTVVGWWLINSSGRYIVTMFCGLADNGLFSIAYKVPAIFNALVGVFLQAWQVSAVKEFDIGDSDHFLSQTYFRTEALLFLACSFLVAVAPLLSKVLFSSEFYNAWVFVPFLTIGSLATSMAGMVAPFFAAKFATRPMVVSTSVSGVVCVAFGLVFVQWFGAQGVAVATMLACIVNWLWRVYEAREYVKVDFRLRSSLVKYLLLFAQSILLLLMPLQTVSIAVQAAIVLFFVWLNRNNLNDMSKTIIAKLKKNRI